MEIINKIYKKASLFSGDFDGVRFDYDWKRHYANVMLDILSYLFFVIHLIVFIVDDEHLNRNLVFLKLTKGVFYRFINLGGGFVFYFCAIYISLYRRYSKNPSQFKWFFFIFYLDEIVMKNKFHLTRLGSKNQVRFQESIFIPMMNIGYVVYSIVLALFVIYLFFENSDFSYGYLFYFQLVFSLLLFHVLRKSVTRILLNCLEIILGTFYLTNRLNKLNFLNIELAKHISSRCQINATRKKADQKFVNLKIWRILNEYNFVVTSQSYMNLHAHKTLSIFIIILMFSVIYPSLLLFDENKSIVSIVFYISNYVCILFFLYPIVHFNNQWVSTVSFF